MDYLSVLEGGFFLIKKPLECVLSVDGDSETAVAKADLTNRWI